MCNRDTGHERPDMMANLQDGMSRPMIAQVPLELYQYDPLPGENYIRTATLLPGKEEDDIIIELATVPLLETGSVEYTALSYAWGSPEIHIYAEVRGVNSDLPSLKHQQAGRRMGVSNNLATALRDLRLEDSPRTMWIDALCIDQGNFEEKAIQVSKIGDIFQRAAHVIAYIGPEETGESTKLLGYLEHIGKNFEYDWITCILDVTTLGHEWNGRRLIDDHNNLLVDAQLQDMIYRLFCRPWFERLWIRQEIALSATKAMITCGRYGVQWEFFLRAWTCLYIHFAQSDSLQLRYLKKLWQVSSLIKQHQYSSLCTLRDSFRGMKCADPRDRLFAVLEMLPKKEKRLVDVDYTKLPEEVYKDVALGAIKAHRNLAILQECELQDGWLGPTWVPNWGADAQVDIGMGSGVKTSRTAAILDASKAAESGILRVAGVEVTVIENLRPSGIDLESVDILVSLGDMFRGFQMEGDYVGGGTLCEAYATAIVRGKFLASTEPNNYNCSTLDDVVKVMQSACLSAATKDLPLKKKSVTDMRLFCAHRQLFRGVNGYVGMAPPATRIGDRIFTILGCDYPLVLRDIGGGRMQVVGSCFVSGAMDNQALLGPLPSDVEVIYMKAKGRSPGFRNRLTKEITYDDPRLSKLPLTDDEKAHLLGWTGGHTLGISLETLHRFNSEVKWVELV